jgi:hypothetical protein
MGVSNSFKIIDDRFSVDRIENYDLLMEIQQTRFKFILRDSTSKTIIWLEDYYLGPSGSISDFIEKLKEVIEDHKFLKANFWNKIAVTVDFPIHIIIPEDLFEENLLERYLKLQIPDFSSTEFEIQTAQIRQDYYIFLIPKVLRALLTNFYQGKELAISSSLYNSLRYFQSHERIQNKNILIFSDEWLQLIFVEPENGNLRTEKLPLASRSTAAFLNEIEKKGQLKSLVFGEITPFSASYRMVKNKLKALEFGGVPRNSTLSQFFAEVPEQRYFTLLSVDF